MSLNSIGPVEQPTPCPPCVGIDNVADSGTSPDTGSVGSSPDSGDETSAFTEVKEEKKQNRKLTLDDLAKAGEGAFKDVPKFMAEALSEEYSKYGLETNEYDLLDDDTGLVNANEEDFETAYAMEKLNSDFNSDYNPSLLKEEMQNIAGETVYKYDSDGDGNFETEVTFDKNGEQISHKLRDENGKVAEIETSGGMDFYDVRTEDGNHPTYNESLDRMYTKEEGGITNEYKFKYNDDGTVKNMTVDKYVAEYNFSGADLESTAGSDPEPVDIEGSTGDEGQQ